MDSLKLFLVVAFFWTASPVSGHMISRLEAMTDEELGELIVMQKGMKTAGEREKEDREKEDREKDLVRIENGKEIKKERGQTENESI